ncbi:hypothetical protein XHC_3329 [Xanthomonas hortorum pv. carotae str. M081]|nr:hypothetical protein XHC_3329 [Xanthomonas hortorum pv. carotae str. M081]
MAWLVWRHHPQMGDGGWGDKDFDLMKNAGSSTGIR